MSQSNKRSYSPQRRSSARPQQTARRTSQARPRRLLCAKQSVLYLWSKTDLIRILIGGTITIVLAWFLQTSWLPKVKFTQEDQKDASVAKITEIYSEGPLRINEIMSSNRSTLLEEDGSSPDWIEIANIGNEAVNLEGYALAKSSDAAQTFAFPKMILQPGEYAIVLADNHLRAENPNALHAPFSLSSAGDTLLLFNAGGTAIDTVNIPALEADVSYVRKDVAHWETSSMPTPGMPNTEEGYRALSQPDDDSPILITEVMAVNTATLADENREYHDYIELYNRSNETIELAGWYLSDDVAYPRKWSFPELTLLPGERLVVFASKLDRKEDVTHLHTNFALASEGEMVVLSNVNGRVMDLVEYDLMKANMAWMRDADGNWSLSDVPSPGA